jgi:phage protein D
MTSVGGATRVLPVDYDFYAPAYEIAVDGEMLGSVTTGDVLDIQVTRELKNASGASLNVSDWDDRAVSFKYSSSDTFALGKFLTIRLGYARLGSSAARGSTPGGGLPQAGRGESEGLVNVFSGFITSMSPRFPDGAPPTLTVAGQDALRRLLANRRPTGREPRQWLNKTNSEIVRDIANRLGLEPRVETTNVRYPRVLIRNQDYATFLVERAALSDFEVYIEPNERRSARSPDRALIFGPRRDGRSSATRTVLDLEWGKNLVTFSPHLSAAQQVKSVTVRGWDPARKRPIEVTVGRSDLRGPASRAGSGPEAADSASAEVVVDRPVHSEQEAREVARALLQERANQFITGTAKTVGVAALQPGDNVRMRGIGSRFSISYLVTKVVHSLGAAGFTTEFEVSGAAGGDTAQRGASS